MNGERYRDIPSGGTRNVESSAVSYPLLAFPWDVWTLTSNVPLPEAQAAEWAAWLNEIEPARLQVIMSVLEEAGAAVGLISDRPATLRALGAWMQGWFGLVAEPFVVVGGGTDGDWVRRAGFFKEQPQLRLGGAWAPDHPAAPGYSLSADSLLHSVALDLAFLVCASSRPLRPSLRWQAARYEHRDGFFVTPDPDPPPFPVIRQIRDFLVQSVARPRGGRGRALREWRSKTLYGCYERATTGKPQIPERIAFPDADEHREGQRYTLFRAKRTDPTPPVDLVDMISAFREAGWFDATKISSSGTTVTWSRASKLTSTDLAKAAQATWQAFEREEIPPINMEMAWRMLLLDSGRTWSEDVDADACPGDDVHEQTLFAIAEIAGDSFSNLCDATEDWTTTPGDVEMSFWLGKRHHELLLPGPGHYLSPALVSGLNKLIPPGKPRLWFADHGPPIAIVTRATAVEKDSLERLTGIELNSDPPGWWTKLAPLPPQ